jgi:Uma2 family endonuclease
MSVDAKLMTAEDLLAMPDDGMLHELVEGELRTMSPAGFVHGDVAGFIHIHLGRFVIDRRLGRMPISETGYMLRRNPDTVRCPDVSFVRKERIRDERGLFNGAPDVAVEVVSPSDTVDEIQEKVLDYLAAGSVVVIVVNPRTRVVTIHTAGGTRQVPPDGSIEAPEILPGWSLPLSELFA